MKKKRNSIKIEVREFEPIPKGYGLAYRELNRLVYICYLIPINLLVRWIREFYFILMRGICPTKTEKLWKAGFNAGIAVNAERLRRLNERASKLEEEVNMVTEDKA